MKNKKHEFRGVPGANAKLRLKRPRNSEYPITRKRQATLLYPSDISLACIQDAELPVVVTSDTAQMQTLKRLSTYKSRKRQPHFLPMQVIAPSKVGMGSDFGPLKLNARRIFLMGPNLENFSRQMRRQGALLYDLNAAAAGGFETLDHCLATEGMDRALEFFDKAERYFKRHVPDEFRLAGDGLYSLAQSQGPESQADDLRICSPIYVRAYTRDDQNQNWGKLIEFLDKDGTRHRCLIPMSALAGQGKECWAQLLSHGLQIAHSPKARDLLIAYILEADPEERVRCANRLGWHNGTFVLPDESIQPENSEAILYQATTKTKHFSRPSGSLADWRNSIGRYSAGNSRLAFPIACAFAAPLLWLTNEPGGGFHLLGGSSIGKTTALRVAASVWGGADGIRTWRITSNSFDAVAANHNDGLLCLDELGQADAREVGAIVYALANGSPKQRMTQNMPQWNLLSLSCGEISLAGYLGAAGTYVPPGQLVRLCDVEADAGVGLGMFEYIHDFPNAAAFARNLTDAARRCHGTPIRAFLQMLVKNREALTQRAIELRDQFLRRHVPTDASGEVRRVASRFALVAAAGELATADGITGWPEGESMLAGQMCFKSWLGRRGVTAVDTSGKIIQQIRYFLETRVASDVQVAQPTSGRRHDLTADARRAGSPVRHQRDGTIHLIDPDDFRRDVCAGLDPKVVLRDLKAQGFLDHDRGRLDKSVRIPGGGKTRVYAIRDSILAAQQAMPVRGNGDSRNNEDVGDIGDSGDIGTTERNYGSLASRDRAAPLSRGEAGARSTAVATQDMTGDLLELSTAAVDLQVSSRYTDSRNPFGGSNEE